MRCILSLACRKDISFVDGNGRPTTLIRLRKGGGGESEGMSSVNFSNHYQLMYLLVRLSQIEDRLCMGQPGCKEFLGRRRDTIKLIIRF